MSKKRDPNMPKPESPYTYMPHSVLDAPAWRALSHGARSLFLALCRRHYLKSYNNGKIYLSQRNAAKELGSHHNEICRWFRELVYYGFIVQTRGGSLGFDGRGKAPHWRLTHLGCNLSGQPSYDTRDYQHWDETTYKEALKIESRAGKSARGVLVNPGILRRQQWRENGSSGLVNQHMRSDSSVRETKHVSNLPYPGRSKPVPHVRDKLVRVRLEQD